MTAAATLAAGLLAAGAFAADDDAPGADPAAPPAFKPLREAVAPEDLSDEQVMYAINGGVDFLLYQLHDYVKTISKVPDTLRGKPGVLANDDLGHFMLIMYTLLYIGQDTGDPRLHFRTDEMKIALDLVLRWDGEGSSGDYQFDTYATSLQALALAQLPPTEDVKKAMARVALRLAGGVTKEGGFSYALGDRKSDRWDHSNSQYAVLGEWAAADWGAPVPADFWKLTDEFWRTGQNSDGGWGYSANSRKQSTFPMTAAGVASLYVCDEFLNRTVRLDPPADTAKDRAMACLVDGFKATTTDYYGLYGLERVGLAAGIKYLGTTNWYRAAAVNLLKHQSTQGQFGGGTSEAGNEELVSTCYCLLFLDRGRAPVVMNKLQYPGLWNARPRDSANLHAYLSKAFERHLNWQIESIDSPVDDWSDAPIMLITGSKAPDFTDDDVAKLRDYVHAGGMIFSVADGGSREFSAAMEKYAKLVAATDDPTATIAPAAAAAESQPFTFPPPAAPAPATAAAATASAGPGRPWRQLPPDHPLYTIYGKSQKPTPLYGISNGIRELWVHCPEDLGAVWQAREMVRSANGTTDVPAKTQEAWYVPARLFFYAAGVEGLRSKLQPLAVQPPKEAPSRKIAVARAKWAGNWNPEPGAWPRLAKLMARDGHADLSVTDVDLADLLQADPRPSLLLVGGTGALKLTAAQEKVIQKYVLDGGTLFVEAMGGNDSFAESATAELQKLFPQPTLKVIPPTYLLYNGKFTPDAVPVTEVKYRKFWTLQNGQRKTPGLRYLNVNSRIAVIYSPDDVTSGLLGTATWPVGGYTAESALKLAWDIVLFAGINDAHAPAASQPATRPDAEGVPANLLKEP